MREQELLENIQIEGYINKANEISDDNMKILLRNLDMYRFFETLNQENKIIIYLFAIDYIYKFVDDDSIFDENINILKFLRTYGAYGKKVKNRIGYEDDFGYNYGIDKSIIVPMKLILNYKILRKKKLERLIALNE